MSMWYYLNISESKNNLYLTCTTILYTLLHTRSCILHTYFIGESQKGGNSHEDGAGVRHLQPSHFF